MLLCYKQAKQLIVSWFDLCLCIDYISELSWQFSTSFSDFAAGVQSDLRKKAWWWWLLALLRDACCLGWKEELRRNAKSFLLMFDLHKNPVALAASNYFFRNKLIHLVLHVFYLIFFVVIARDLCFFVYCFALKMTNEGFWDF